MCNKFQTSFLRTVVLILSVCIIFSCNDREEIEPTAKPPVITLDSETGVYLVKTGRSVTITPIVENTDNATYSWVLDNETVGTKPEYTFAATTTGSFFLTFNVTTPAGNASEEIRIDVADLAPPVISFVLPPDGMQAETGRSYILAPDVQNKEGAVFEWKLENEIVGSEETYTFKGTELGNYILVLKVVNEDGQDERTVDIKVVERYPLKLLFVKPTFFAANTNKTVALGKTLFLRPYMEYARNPVYTWEVDGDTVAGVTGQTYAFTPEQKKGYQVKVTVTDNDTKSIQQLSKNITRTAALTASAEITVVCGDAEGTHKRPVTGSSSPFSNNVFEYIPAPGQFIHETGLAGFKGDETTHEKAIAYAEARLRDTNLVSLGGWGGYIIVGFDHSIENRGSRIINGEGYDIAIGCNAFPGSSEPGIVYVMQDVNGNGLPDDEWYELKGSEYGKAATIQDYAVTYYRPAGAKMSVSWTDNREKFGSIPYLGQHHAQPYYYPAWIAEDTYTLYGTCLESRVSLKNGLWYNGEFDWGYADNFGNDRYVDSNNPNMGAKETYFKISNAVNLDGTPVNLSYIDFIKVQTATNAVAGGLGENSTEVLQFRDLNIIK